MKQKDKMEVMVLEGEIKKLSKAIDKFGDPNGDRTKKLETLRAKLSGLKK